MNQFSSSYYEDLQGRLRATLIRVAVRLPASTFEFAMEELDANELGLTLETIVETLVEVGVVVPNDIVTDLAGLAAAMKMDYDVEAALRPAVP